MCGAGRGFASQSHHLGSLAFRAKQREQWCEAEALACFSHCSARSEKQAGVLLIPSLYSLKPVAEGSSHCSVCVGEGGGFDL